MASQYHHAAFMNIQRGGGGVGSLFALRDLWIDGGMDGWMDHEWGESGREWGGPPLPDWCHVEGPILFERCPVLLAGC